VVSSKIRGLAQSECLTRREWQGLRPTLSRDDDGAAVKAAMRGLNCVGRQTQELEKRHLFELCFPMGRGLRLGVISV